MKKYNSVVGVVGCVKKVFCCCYQYQVLFLCVIDIGKLCNIVIVQGFIDFVCLLLGYDVIIQVGGLFFVDFYGVLQFEYVFCIFMVKKLLFMIGYSVGLFQDE